MRISGNILPSILVVLGIVGLLSPFQYNVAPVLPILEAALFFTAALVFSPPKKEISILFFFGAAYVLFKMALMILFRQPVILDFAQAYKAFIYIIPLGLIYKKKIFNERQIVGLIKFCISIFFIKYSYSLLLDLTPRMGSRPGVYVENNFELIFLLLLFYSFYHSLGRSKVLWAALLALTVIISGSRSSALALLIIFSAIYVTKLNFRALLYFFIFIFLLVAVAILFESRMEGGGIESIDRYRFAMIFISEIKGWPLWKFITGSFPMTPLSGDSCAALSYYGELFSKSDPSVCYSVILHSYLLRVIFDHGLIGLFILAWLVYVPLKNIGYSSRQIIVISSVLLVSSLSVSAMNSVFTAVAFAFMFGVKEVSDGNLIFARKIQK